jgi:hypothetical protein
VYLLDDREEAQKRNSKEFHFEWFLGCAEDKKIFLDVNFWWKFKAKSECWYGAET